MPNTFGGYPLVDPRCVREHRGRFRRDLFPELDLANSYYSTVGLWPDVGWLLLDRASYDELNPYATNLQLVIQDFAGNPALTIGGVSIVQARCVTRGIAADSNAIYLLQVTNSEGVVYNPWFQYPTASQYNVRAPAYDQGYYSTTMNSGTPWTWDGMVGDLWSQASALLGTYPHLPTTPAGTPENFSFVGVPLWEAINRILDYLGMTVSGTNSGYAITTCGAADAVYSSKVSLYSKYLIDSMEYLDAGSGRVPRAVVVYFHRRGQVYGIEETERQDSLQWQSTPYYSVTVAAPAAYSSAAGTAYLWSDFAVRYDVDGVPLPADTATAAIIAAERVTQFFGEIRAGGYRRDTYSGVLPFVTGSQVDGVRWYHSSSRDGWHTEVVRGWEWPEVKFERLNK